MGLKPRPPGPRDDFAVGQIYAVELDAGGWTACQIIDLAPDMVELLSLELLLDRRPTLDGAAAAEPLALTHWSWNGQIERTWIGRKRLPSSFHLLGRCPLIYEPETKGISYGRPGSLGLQVRLKRDWFAVPQEARDGYARAREATGRTSITLGSGAVELALGAHRLNIGPADMPGRPNIEVGSDERLRWTALDPLGGLTELTYRGRDVSIAAYLGTRPLIGTLFWYPEGLVELDLRESMLREVFVACTGVHRIDLPARCEILRLSGDIAGLRISHPRHGKGMELYLYDATPPLAEIRGLDALHRLSVCKVDRFDCAQLGRFAQLRELSLNDIGRIDGLDALASLASLTTIELGGCYDFDADTFPTHASRVDIDGLRTSDAATLRSRLAGLERLTIRGAKNEAWLAVNLGNPFRDWIDSHAGKGKAACAAYTKAFKAIAKGAALESVLRDFVAAFNALAAKHGLDTVDCEDVYGAFGDLVCSAGEDEDIDRWDAAFEEWRDF